MEILKKMLSSEKGRSLTLITALLVAVGMALMLVGPADSGSPSRNQSEKSIKKLCEKVCSEGEVYVTVNSDENNEVLAIAVVCKNGDNPNVKLKITEMLSTLYCIPSARIYVTDYG